MQECIIYFYDVMIPSQYRKETPMSDVEKIVRLLLVTSVTTTTKVEAQYCLGDECVDCKNIRSIDTIRQIVEEEIRLIVSNRLPKLVLDRLGISTITIIDVLTQAVAYIPDGKIEDALVDIRDSFVFLDEVLTAISKSELLHDHLKLAIKATLDLPSGILFADISTTIKAIKDRVVSCR